MRQGSNPKRLRGRTGRKNPHTRSQNFESNGPEVKVRGNAQQVVEKYLALARDASSAGDRITAESYFQHAEHYYRVMTANGGGNTGEDRNNQNAQNGHNNRQNGEQEAHSEQNGTPHRAPIEVVSNGADMPEAQENGTAAAQTTDEPAPEPQTQD